MPHYKKMVGEKCYLSPCSMEDAEKYTEWENDLEVAIPLGDEANTLVSLEKMQNLINDTIQRQSNIFSIIDLQTDALIGRCMLFNLDQINLQAMLGIMIGEKSLWDKGYGQDAVRLLLDFAFNLLNLNNVMLGTFSFNERALHAYKKVGFKEIGRRRQARIIAGKKYDVILMDILAEEFQSAYVSRLLT